jgi:hypothetical protein
MIAAATRLSDAWARPELDMVERHEVVVGLIRATQTRDFESALDVCHDVGAG